MDSEEAAGPPRLSPLLFYFRALGLPSLLLFALVTLLAIGLVLLLFARGRGSAVPAAMMLVLPLPLIIALVGFLAGSIGLLNSMAQEARPSEMAEWMGYGLTTALQGIGCFCPLLLLTLTVLIVLGFQTSNSKTD